MRGAGGTEGGVAQFFVGLAMALVGACLLTRRATAPLVFWGLFGSRPFGLAVLPLLVGAAMLLFERKSRLGRVLTLGGALIILLGILTNLRTYLEPTSLVDTLATLVPFVGGLALVARSLRPRRGSGGSQDSGVAGG